MERKRKLIFFRNHFKEFFEPLNDKAKEKIDYVLFLVVTAERIPKKFFKHLTGTDGLFEIRVEFESNIYRVFCCFDQGNMVVLFNGFQKKSQKTPRQEIDKALRIRDEYFTSKNQNDEKRKRFL